MVYAQEFLLVMPIVIFGGIVIWITTFLETYCHFPKMNKNNRIMMSVNNATILVLTIMAIVSLFAIFMMKWVLQ